MTPLLRFCYVPVRLMLFITAFSLFFAAVSMIARADTPSGGLTSITPACATSSPSLSSETPFVVITASSSSGTGTSSSLHSLSDIAGSVTTSTTSMIVLPVSCEEEGNTEASDTASVASSPVIEADQLQLAAALDALLSAPSATSTPALTVSLDAPSFTESEQATVLVHPRYNNASTTIIFYTDPGANGEPSYAAETVSHGHLPFSVYFSPPPGAGTYTMIEYDNDGQFDCSGISLSDCAADSHFLGRFDFTITE